MSTQIKTTKVVFLSMLLTISGIEANASDCGVMHYLGNKSQGIRIQNNSCADNQISIGTNFLLNPGARLWLISLPSENSDADFQLICQNRATETIDVSMSSMFIPWISPKKLNNCSGWIDNKLRCDSKQGGKNQFFCAIASIKRPDYSNLKTVVRTTSVKMRSAVTTKPDPSKTQSKASKSAIREVVAFMELEANLCRDIFLDDMPNKDHSVAVNWVIDLSGKVNNVSMTLKNSETDQDYAACIEDVVRNFQYPKFSKKVDVSYDF